MRSMPPFKRAITKDMKEAAKEEGNGQHAETAKETKYHNCCCGGCSNSSSSFAYYLLGNTVSCDACVAYAGNTVCSVLPGGTSNCTRDISAVTPVIPIVADFEKVLSVDVGAALGTTTTIAYTAPTASTSGPLIQVTTASGATASPVTSAFMDKLGVYLKSKLSAELMKALVIVVRQPSDSTFDRVIAFDKAATQAALLDTTAIVPLTANTAGVTQIWYPVASIAADAEKLVLLKKIHHFSLLFV